ncbi:hypothetical protein I203_100536 [Kwoniella mangroviensis CBS 8507]|uniref:uncharacterized protein n=1 Tax=Kwoniella mangroviensis CBS 8507 TaxID=1296122 RepID=UPI00080D4AEA|nr:RNA-binding protein rnp24 [Kwoniella mangroviensis CBS 8507]OCF63791.1 RNA-binding protein rnp24 [Kwoniella mangroviensis CBS 8507]
MSGEPSSSSSKISKKSGRTPEQQAARDARKAAKLAAKSSTSTSTTAVTELPAEVPAQTDGTEGDAESSKKRKRVVPEGEELEIDVSAAAPLSKAELRAQRKKAKRGEEVEVVKREYEKPDKLPKEKTEGEGEVTKQDGIASGGSGKRQNSIWIANLSFKTTVESLTEFFEKNITEAGGAGNGSITRINMPKKNSREGFAQNKGFAYVDFKSPELQALAVGLSEKFFEGRKVLIKKGDDHGPTPNARTPKPLSTKAEDLGSSSRRPETSSLYMGNLPFDATELAIRDQIEENAVEREQPSEEQEALEEIGERGGKKSGLKKVRLGAFEDTGRCKGFAFLDFISVRHAKVALVNRKNHYFNGRRLTVEFASEEAAKRSGGKSKPRLPTGDKPKKFYESTPAGETSAGVEQDGTTEDGPVEKKNDKRGKKWEVTGRPRPGAALAMAKRENVGIVEGSGQKITFD